MVLSHWFLPRHQHINVILILFLHWLLLLSGLLDLVYLLLLALLILSPAIGTLKLTVLLTLLITELVLFKCLEVIDCMLLIIHIDSPALLHLLHFLNLESLHNLLLLLGRTLLEL